MSPDETVPTTTEGPRPLQGPKDFASQNRKGHILEANMLATRRPDFGVCYHPGINRMTRVSGCRA